MSSFFMRFLSGTRLPSVAFALLGVVLSAVDASAIWPGAGTQRREYTIHGYLDRAPAGAKKLDQVTITASGLPSRELVIGKYGMPGDVPPFAGQLSRSVVPYYVVYGSAEAKLRLMNAPAGSAVEGTFVVTPGSSGSLYIIELTSPPAQG